MDGIRRIIGLAAGIAAGAFIAPAHAETNDGVAFEFEVSAAEIELMSVVFGRFSTPATAPGVPLMDDDSRDSSVRYDARVSGFAFDVFGRSGEGYLRGAYQDAAGGASASFSRNSSDNAAVPTGLADTAGGQESRNLGATGFGTIAVARRVDQSETEIAAGFVFGPVSGFAPRVEVGYRRGEVDQRIRADRVGVTPILEEFSTNTTSLSSDCADLGAGISKTLPLSRTWSFAADASAAVSYCGHDLSGRFDFTDGFGVDISNGFEDDDNGLSARLALSAGLVWQLTDALALGANAYVRADSGAPFVAFQTYTSDEFGNLDSRGNIRIETESRASYGAGLSLRAALN